MALAISRISGVGPRLRMSPNPRNAATIAMMLRINAGIPASLESSV